MNQSQIANITIKSKLVSIAHPKVVTTTSEVALGFSIFFNLVVIGFGFLLATG